MNLLNCIETIMEDTISTLIGVSKKKHVSKWKPELPKFKNLAASSKSFIAEQSGVFIFVTGLGHL